MKIANKISLSIFILVIILTLRASFFVYNIEKQNLEDIIFKHLITTAHSRAHHVETFLKMYKDATRQLAADLVFENFLRIDEQGAEYSKTFDMAMEELGQMAKSRDTIYEAFILDKDGKIVASSNSSRIGLDKSEDTYFLGAKAGAYVKDAYCSEAEKTPAMAFSAPIIDPHTAKFLGVMVLRIKLDELNEITTSRVGLGETGEIYLINEQGYMITPSRFVKDTFLKLRVDTENSRAALQCMKEWGIAHQEYTPIIFPDYRDRIVLGVREIIPETKWFLLAEIDRSEALAPLGRLKILFLVLISIVPLVAFLIGIFFSRISLLDGVTFHLTLHVTTLRLLS